jgi:26S proteasome non-ATPase regulatory subunit 10
LHFAASKANLDIARMLVEHKASTRTKDRRQQLPIHRAAAVGSVPVLKLLLENRSPINTADVDGMTPLHHGTRLSFARDGTELTRAIAISEGHGDAAVFLLKQGAESNKKNTEGELAINMAPDAKVSNSLPYCRQNSFRC